MKKSFRTSIFQIATLALAFALAFASSSAFAADALIPVTLQIPLQVTIPPNQDATVTCVISGPGGQLGTGVAIVPVSGNPIGFQSYNRVFSMRVNVPELPLGTTYSCNLKVTHRILFGVDTTAGFHLDTSVPQVQETSGTIR